MEPHRRLTRYTHLCLAAFLVTITLFAISTASDHTGEIVFGYVAFLVFLFVSLPLHLLGISATIYTGVRSPRVAQPAWPYFYFGLWTVIHVIIFRAFLFEEVPNLARQAMFAVTHEEEIELARALQRHESDPARVGALIEAGADAKVVVSMDSNTG